jgi:hypothetical protein
MKLYVFDFGWQGAMVIVAASMAEAMTIVKRETPDRYSSGEPDEYEIAEGVVIDTKGIDSSWS